MSGVLSVLAFGALGFWILVFLDRRRAWPRSQYLPRPLEPSGAAGGGDAPHDPPAEVAAIVPARDEAEVLGETLPALLKQDAPFFQVVLVDDRSTDGTARRARRLAAMLGRPEKLRVVEGIPPPPGWSGKVHALEVGLAALDASPGGSPEWILLTDADIRHPPDSVRALLERAAASGHDLVSVMARLQAKGFWERLLIPPFVFFFQLLYPFRVVSDPRSRAAAAAGGCILIRRDALSAIGDFAAIAGEVIDDVALAREVRRAGGRPWLGFDPLIASVRPYPRLRDIWQMVARTAFVQLRHRWDLLALTTAALLWVLVSPPVLIPLALLNRQPAAAAAALGAWLLAAALLYPSVRHHRAPAAYALGLPAAGFLYMLMTLSSAWDHLRGRGPLWKGRRLTPEKAAGSPALRSPVQSPALPSDEGPGGEN